MLQELKDLDELMNRRFSCRGFLTKAVEQKFDVRVMKVSTINQLGKQKQLTVKSGGRTIRTSGYRASFKKAIVTLK